MAIVVAIARLQDREHVLRRDRRAIEKIATRCELEALCDEDLVQLRREVVPLGRSRIRGEIDRGKHSVGLPIERSRFRSD